MDLSIVIPTLNRCGLLEGTLRKLMTEVRYLSETDLARLEVVVVDNASTDGTHDLCAHWPAPFFRYSRYKEKVEIGRSIARAIGEARGKYVWVMGDDDYFSAGLIGALIQPLSLAQGVDMFYFNRVILDWKFTEMKRVAQPRWNVLEEDLSMGDFIRRYSHWPGFITAMIFRHQAYVDGAEFDRPEFEAWEFLARIYYGGRKGNVRVHNFPVIGQRLGVHAWKASWPRYWLINMPKMLHALEMAGATSGAVEEWRSQEVSLKRITIDAVVAKAFGLTSSDSFWREAAAYQRGLKRASLLIIGYGLPCFLARLAYKIQPKYRK
jgi:glycosyltransferase involved in cell wall biosynthesis